MRKLFIQIVRALTYCESKNIAHRDLKPENILLCPDGTIKVSDFGLSSLYKDPSNITNLLLTTCGTINYLAPEVIQNSGYDGHIADIWSLGVILFFACSGSNIKSCQCLSLDIIFFLFEALPFEDDNIARLLDKIVTANYEMPKTFSNALKGELSLTFLNPVLCPPFRSDYWNIEPKS